jgi:hypothetical protein
MRKRPVVSTTEARSLSLWERVGVRDYGLSLGRNPLTRIASQSDLAPWERCDRICGAFRCIRAALPLNPLQLHNQHIQRLREHHAAALGQAFRNDDALSRRIETFECRMQQKGLAVIPRMVAGL